MRKPTVRTFFVCYGMLWLAALVAGIHYAPPGMEARAIILVNLIFICINLIGASFASCGFCPWREKSEVG